MPSLRVGSEAAKNALHFRGIPGQCWFNGGRITAMKLLIFGGTGRTGRALVEQALEQGHVVTVFARDPAKLGMAHENLRVMKGAIAEYDSVETAIKGQDAVLSALGTRPHVELVVILVVICQAIARALALSRVSNLLLRIAVP